ncbi:hypothetical protein [Streptomyces sp. NPDC058045]|uniref:hypothetical protein n=1 Tax=Streptomyces sp. NPDC058045 TaxID=3346311 RepID=UPI0036E628C0
MRRNAIRSAAAGALLAGALAGGLTAAPAQASASGGASTQSARWHCTGDSDPDVDGRQRVYTTCTKGKSSISATFYARGEHLYVYDHFKNGHRTVVYLRVDGSGTAKFTTGHHNLSYSENKDVYLKVCTSSSSKAFCSAERRGTT